MSRVRLVSLLLLGLGSLVALVMATLPLRLQPEPKRTAKIGVISPTWANSQGLIYPVLRLTLEKAGYVDGENASIVARFSEGRDDRLDTLVAELVAEKVDIIVALQPGGALAAQRGTKTIPIVFLSISDPVRIGLVKSMRHPGGNITGVANTPADLNQKRLEILKDALPDLKQVAILARSGNPNSQAHLKGNVWAATRLGMTARVYNIAGPDQFEQAFAQMVADGVEGVLLVQDGVFYFNRQRAIDLAVKHRLPLIADGRIYAHDGAFLSYGIPDYGSLVSAAVERIDLILRGVPAGEIPVDQPMDIGLAVNVATARKIGVPVARSLLLRADDIFE